MSKPSHTPVLNGLPMGHKWIERLVTEAVISRDQVRDAEAISQRLGICLDAALIGTGYIDETVLMRTKAETFGLEFIELDAVEFTETIRCLIPESVARQQMCVPIGDIDQMLKVAVIDPLRFDEIDKLGFILGRPITPVFARKADILSALDRCYGALPSENPDEVIVLEQIDKYITFSDIVP